MWDFTSLVEVESGPNLMSEGVRAGCSWTGCKDGLCIQFSNIKLNCLQHLVQDKSRAISCSCRQLNMTVFESS